MLEQIATAATADTQPIAEQTVFAPLAAAGGLRDLTAAVAVRSMEANAVAAAQVRRTPILLMFEIRMSMMDVLQICSSRDQRSDWTGCLIWCWFYTAQSSYRVIC